MDIENNFFTERAVRPRKTLPGEAVELQPLEIFERCVGVVLRDTGGRVVLGGRLDSMILRVFLPT